MQDYIFKNGLFLGSVQVVLLFVSYLMGIDFMLETWWGVFQFLVSLSLIIYFSFDFRNKSGGYVSFKESFSVSFGIYAAAGFILTFFNILLYNFIDVEFAVLAKEIVIEKTYEMMEGFGASEAIIEDAIEDIENQDSFSIGNLAKSYVLGLPFYIILSLIVAAFIKKNKPEFQS